MRSPLSRQNRIGLRCDVAGRQVTLGAAGGRCVVSDCCMLKSVLVPSVLHFTQFCQSSFFINLSNSYCNTINIAHNNYNNDDIQWQDYIAINSIQFNSLAILT